jgi:hypothetical protein
VKRSGRDKPMWVAIHMCMETLRISLYIYLYLKLTKTLYLSYYLLCFLFNKIGEQEGRTGSALKQGEGEEREGGLIAQRMYIHVSKCKNNKKKWRELTAFICS